MSETAAWTKAHSTIRRHFPRLEEDQFKNRRLYLNSAAGTHMVDSAIQRLSEAALALNPMPGRVTQAERATGDFHERVRSLAADFLHASNPSEISFHFSSTAALRALSYAMRSILKPENNIIVTNLDHMANISPWEDFWGGERGMEIRRAGVTPEGRLDIERLLSIVDEKTGIVAVALASNGFGTVIPLKDVVAAVKSKAPDCRIVVDAVHHALHGPIDIGQIGCDALAFSGYKVFGPMIGVLWVRENLGRYARPYRVETNKNEPPFKFEMGMLNNAVLASLEAALEYLLSLYDRLELGGGGTTASRAERFRSVMESVARYEAEITEIVLDGFRAFDPASIRLFGLADPASASERDPTFAFEVRDQSAEETKLRLWSEYGIQIADGNHYSAAVVRHLGRPALCRASFAHYDTTESARRLVEALGDIVR